MNSCCLNIILQSYILYRQLKMAFFVDIKKYVIHPNLANLVLFSSH